jgi:hypothetical protein
MACAVTNLRNYAIRAIKLRIKILLHVQLVLLFAVYTYWTKLEVTSNLYRCLKPFVYKGKNFQNY